MAEEATSHGSVRPELRERMTQAVHEAATATSGLVVLIGEHGPAAEAWDAVLRPPSGPSPSGLSPSGLWRRSWCPRDAGDLLAGLRASVPVAPWTVVRISDLRAVLMPVDAVLGAEVASTLRGVLRRPADRPLLVAATMPVDREGWRLLTEPPASGGHDRWAQARALLREAAVLIMDVPSRPGAGRPGASRTAELPESEPVPSGAVLSVAVPPDAGWPGSDQVGGDLPETVLPGSGGSRARDGDEPESDRELLGENTVVMMGTAVREGVPRWVPAALPGEGQSRPTPEEVRLQALDLERAGNPAGAVRLYERAAHEGDLVALSGLARLWASHPAGLGGSANGHGAGQRGAVGGADDDIAEMFRRAADERNTGVLFGLAAAGHPGALDLLTRLRAEAALQS